MLSSKLLISLVGVVVCASPVSATISIASQYGIAVQSNGDVVADGTLWALIVDNGDNSFAGAFGLNSSVFAEAGTNAGRLNSVFGGKELSIGSIFAGDTVFAIGGFDSRVLGIPGTVSAASTGLDMTTNGLSENANYAFFYFPGVTFSATSTSFQLSTQIGGVNTSRADEGALLSGMIIPGDGKDATSGASTPGDLGGSFPTASFKAVDLVPEPSTALLGVLGALGLLRRRRN